MRFVTVVGAGVLVLAGAVVATVNAARAICSAIEEAGELMP